MYASCVIKGLGFLQVTALERWVVFRAVYIMCYQRPRVSTSYGLGKVDGL